MPTIPVPNGVMVEMIYTYNGQRMENVYYVSKGSPASAGDLVAIATVFKDWENVTARILRHGSCSLVLISLHALDSAGSPAYDLPVSPPLAGTQGNMAMPSYVTIAVKHTSGLGGRSYRGRSYWIGLASGYVTSTDLVTIAFSNSVTAAYNTLRANLATAGWTMEIVSRYSGIDSDKKPIPRVSGIMTPILASQCGIGLDTQRHRKLPQVV